MSELSIVIPARARKPLNLKRCLESLEANAPGAEVIIVFDEADFYFANKVEKAFPHHKVLLDYDNKAMGGGCVHPTWVGVEAATKEFVGMIGDDVTFNTPHSDILIPRRIKNSEHDSVWGMNDGVDGSAHAFMRREWWLAGGGWPKRYYNFYGDSEIFWLAKEHNRWHVATDVSITHHHFGMIGKVDDIHIIDSEEDARDFTHNKYAALDEKTFSIMDAEWVRIGKPRTMPYDWSDRPEIN